jgi:type II secretion system (T2SS) protein E
VKLGTLLMRDGVITRAQLEAALRAQVLFGGKLGTNLVELGHLSLDRLSEYLERTLEVPAAASSWFAAADPAAGATLDGATAWRLAAFPLCFEDGSGGARRLAVAVVEATDRRVVSALESATGLPVHAYVAPELVIAEYLERRYPESAPPMRAGRRRFASSELEPVAAPAPAPAVRLPRVLAPVVPRTVAAPPPRRAGPRTRVTKPVRAPSRRLRPAAAIGPVVSLGDCLRRLRAARSRDEIADHLIGFAGGRLEAAVLFLVKDQRALGWKGFGAGAAVDHLVLPLAPPSPLARPFQERRAWRGALPPARVPPELCRAVPAGETLIAPVLLGGEVVNLLYGSGPALDDGTADAVLGVIQAAGEAYARLIRAALPRSRS